MRGDDLGEVEGRAVEGLELVELVQESIDGGRGVSGGRGLSLGLGVEEDGGGDDLECAEFVVGVGGPVDVWGGVGAVEGGEGVVEFGGSVRRFVHGCFVSVGEERCAVCTM